MSGRSGHGRCRAPGLVVLGVVVLAPGAVTVHAERDAEERLRELEKKVEAALTSAERTDRESRGILGEVDALDRSIAEREAELADLRASILGRKQARDRAEARIEALEVEHGRLHVAVMGRARGLHRLARRGWGPVLFRAPGDLGDALRFRRYLTAVLAEDAVRLHELAESAERLAAARDDAARLATELADLRERRSLEISRLRARRASKQAALAKLEGERSSQRKLAEELAASAEKLRAWLVASSRRREADPPPASRSAEAATIVVPVGDGPVLPLAGQIGDVSVARNGVEIEAEEGTPVVAIRPGMVVFADWFPGYGRMVIVDHGEHLHSIYGSASELLVGVDEPVVAGQPIARVGATGLARSPRLYFEIRVAGQAKPPEGVVPALAARVSRTP